uniref:Patatin n=1 Tax=Kalanchoe fedtschenkoi TaxID=63787 RepID=A0A7N0V2T0_KALFE
MEANHSGMKEPSIDSDKLSYEIFSILESKFLFGYNDQKLWIQKQVSPPEQASESVNHAIKNQRGKICLLSIDGGGMRGLLPGKALAYLELALKNKSGNPDARIADYFDVAAGTGVGGIFTAMLFGTKDQRSPIFRADETWKLLADNGKSIYASSAGNSRSSLQRCFKSGSSRRGGSGMEKMMNEAFTSDARVLTLKDTLKPVLIPCYDLSSSAPFLFSRADALETDSFDFRLDQVCRATSADPKLFGPVEMMSVDGQTKCVALDGGLVMSNPTAAAITHVLHNKQEFPFVRGVEDILVLSLGTTGQLLEANYDYGQVKKWKAKEWASYMARISSDSSADVVDQSVAMAFGHSRSRNYVRIQANGSNLGRCVANVDTDGSPKNMKMLIEMAEEMLKQKNVESVMFSGKRIGDQSNYEKLDWFAGELVIEHQRRSCRIAPTVAFKQLHPNPS